MKFSTRAPSQKHFKENLNFPEYIKENSRQQKDSAIKKSLNIYMIINDP